jgi:iron complex outermembrane receptor protein
MNYPLDTAAAGRFDFTLTANWNSTDVERVPTTAQLAALSPPPVLFDRVNVLTFEDGQPKNKYSAAINWSLSAFGATLRATRYGEVLSPDTAATFSSTTINDVELSAKTLIDLEARWNITDHFRLALGADNLTDEYPDVNPPAVNTTGTTSFSNYSPFGRSGRFVYGRLGYRF